jgi:hypothetical protein
MRKPAYSICTLVNDFDQYNRMKASFIERGFRDSEFLIIDNSVSNQMDAYDGLNCLLNESSGAVVILCHQDVVLVDDGRPQLDRIIADISDQDPKWAVLGNAGCHGYRNQYFYITDRYGKYRARNLPAAVNSLDENFIVVKASTRLGFSTDIGGFHMYGTDICMQAEMRGFTSYVIPFHLYHDGEGRMGEPFHRCKLSFQSKWRNALRHRLIETSATRVMITGANCPQWYSHLKFRFLKIRHKLLSIFSS